MESASVAIAGGIGWLLIGMAIVGTLYTVAAMLTLRRFFARAPVFANRTDGVTILKPLHGPEPRLADNLATFLAQDHDGPIQLLCGVQRADDPAIAAVEALRARCPGARIDLIVDPACHGANGKIANLVNMAPHIAHDVVVLSDSDMVAPRDYLTRLLDALDAPAVGAVTLAYGGRGDAGFWSRVAAAGLGWQFLPGVVFGSVRGLARPCMGSTIAMRRDTLAAIGGFAAFADVLADDHAIGGAVAALGLGVEVAPLLVTHASTERDLPALWRHELRWGATVRDLQPVGYVLGVIAMPLPVAVLALPFHPLAGVATTVCALAARLAVAMTADRIAGRRTAPYWLLPLRDGLTFAVFVASLVTRSVDWRGATLRMERHGRVSAEAESTPS